MLYKKNTEPTLRKELFENPTAEYRGTPFWAWNGKLEKEELLRQIEFFKQMGLGGFHMHVRAGLETEYLSDEFMDLIAACVDKAKQEDMLAWLYDEDRYPSGNAGGIVTRDKKFRRRRLLFTLRPYAENGTGLIRERRVLVDRNGKPLPKYQTVSDGWFVQCYDVVKDANGCLLSAESIAPENEAKGEKWYAYVIVDEPSPRMNNQTYTDLLNKEAIDEFIRVTHDRYAEKVGAEFGSTVPAIFTDEPAFNRYGTLAYSGEKSDIYLPWSECLPEIYREKHGGDLMAMLPEVIWQLPHNRPSENRWKVHDFIAEQFVENFMDNIGAWCDAHGIALTGHVLHEETMDGQAGAVGEAMRNYRRMALPGIDMLLAGKEFLTAKQAQSAVHQYGREGMMSELYGVTGWDFDFRGHKYEGDWQAALGVTVRVHHLSWYTMKGEAKRGYPATIHYQSPWAEQYRLVEDHFARLNTALTRGKPDVRIGVIHPIESYWLNWGPLKETEAVRQKLDGRLEELIRWLLMDTLDFDLISESLLPELCDKGGAPLRVGAMAYDAIVVPDCQTLRTSTLERLEAFRQAGGRLIFVGDAPALENAVPSERGKRLYADSIRIPFSRPDLLDVLEPVRSVGLRSLGRGVPTDLVPALPGRRADGYVYQLRQDSDCKWLFLAHAKNKVYNPDVPQCEPLEITIRGEYVPEIYDTLTGEIQPVDYTAKNGTTVLRVALYDYDSLLLRLVPGAGERKTSGAPVGLHQPVEIPAEVAYTLSEPNVLLLDRAEVALNGGAFEPEEELLRAFSRCCQKLHLDWENAHTVQPWAYDGDMTMHTATLRFAVNSKITVNGACFALENAELSRIRVNGSEIPMNVDGWFTDRSIKTVRLPELHPGKNIIEVDTPVGATTGLEWCYLLGDFGVILRGKNAYIVEKPETVGFDSVVHQGLPFYGGNITYHVPVVTEGGALTLRVPQYRGGLVRAALDGADRGAIVYSPYTLTLENVPAGAHMLDITVYGNRQNCFGPVHLADSAIVWISSSKWRTTKDSWTDGYRLKPLGLLREPELTEEKK